MTGRVRVTKGPVASSTGHHGSPSPSPALPSSLPPPPPPSSSSSHKGPKPHRQRRAHQSPSDEAAAAATLTATGQDLDTSSLKSGTVRSRRKQKEGIAEAAGSFTDEKRKIRTGATQVDGSTEEDVDTNPEGSMPTLPPAQTTHPRWVLFALFSGAFAALNGVFAKLTTSSDTPPGADLFTHLLPFLDPTVTQVLLRGLFFGLNIASNAVMWVLFTRALTSHPSTTKVAVVNTSANFALTAVMGALIFRESVGGVGGLAGLALLVAGCVVLGAKKEKGEGETDNGAQPGAVGLDGPVVDAEAGAAFPDLEPYTDEDPFRDDITEDTAVEDEDMPNTKDNTPSGSYRPGHILDGTESDDEDKLLEDE